MKQGERAGKKECTLYNSFKVRGNLPRNGKKERRRQDGTSTRPIKIRERKKVYLEANKRNALSVID